MYIDVIVLVILILIVVMFFKRFSSFVFFMAIVDLFLRIMAFIRDNCGLPDLSHLLRKYLPSNMFEIIDKYLTPGQLPNIILKWCFVILMIIFLGYIVKIFIHKKKI